MTEPKPTSPVTSPEPALQAREALDGIWRLLDIASAAGRKMRLQEQASDLRNSHEVRMFAVELARGNADIGGAYWDAKQTVKKLAAALTQVVAREPGVIQANSIASEKVCDHPSTEKADAIAMPRELTDRQADAANSATASWLDVKGSALTVNREKMKARYRALVRFMEKQGGETEAKADYSQDGLPTEAASEENPAKHAGREAEGTHEVTANSAGQVIANPANLHGRSPESSESSLLGRETVREETIEECAKIAEGCLIQVYPHNSSGLLAHQIDLARADVVKAIRALSPLKD